MKTFLGILIGASALFFLSWFTVYKLNINTLAIQSEDTLPAMFMPFAIINENTIYLDSYYKQLITKYPQPDDKTYVKGNVPFYLEKINNHYVSAFTIITPIIILPIYFIPILLGVGPTWPNLIILSHVAEALIMSLSGYLVYLISVKYLGANKKQSLIVTIVYLFGSINFALISQALWQHGTVQLLVLAGLFFYLKNQYNHLYLSVAGFFWGFAFLARPTALLPLTIFGLLILFMDRNLTKSLKQLVPLGLGLLPAILFFVWYNSTYYKSFSNQGYSQQLFTSWLGNFPVSLFGVWISPSKGILVYSPVFIFSLVGFFISLKNKVLKDRNLYIAFGIILLIHTVVISFWKHWYGGWSFGYRMSSDVIPFFALLIIPFLQSSLYTKYKKFFWFLLAISVLVEFAGIIFFDGVWHAAYDRGFHDTSWLWSIKDSEFIFNVRRVLVKLHLLDRACPKCLPL